MFNRSDIPSDCTILCSRVDDARRENDHALRNLPGYLVEYPAIDENSGNEVAAKAALRKTHLPEVLRLKVGAKLIPLANVDIQNGWVNGTICTLKTATESTLILGSTHTTNILQLTKMERSIEYTSFSRTQFPVDLAWSFTIHKVQSLTLSKVAIDIEEMFAPGQLYVALSRVKRLQDLYILNNPYQNTISNCVHNRDTIVFLQRIANFFNTTT